MKPNLKPIIQNSTTLLYQQNKTITQFGKSGHVEKAYKLFTQMTHKNTVTFNSMISVYSKNGLINNALNLFDKMPHRNVVSWNTMIAGCLHNERVDIARKLFSEMPVKDVFTWTLMITCCSKQEAKGKSGKYAALRTMAATKATILWTPASTALAATVSTNEDIASVIGLTCLTTLVIIRHHLGLEVRSARLFESIMIIGAKPLRDGVRAGGVQVVMFIYLWSKVYHLFDMFGLMPDVYFVVWLDCLDMKTLS
ncbi:Pentatricopeptide repeat-containing protein [Artemisia annua]|uniref:Pentatricopeptide repeat-containing protein n=1 Tax=Artemisia annua TaxID=35608 RepID=A0A2U1Q900_ARTAN|nr:Pentatricopeptide repeat-containing protein [Artemisia annua]